MSNVVRAVLVKKYPTNNSAGTPSTTQRRFALYRDQVVLIDPKTYGEDPDDEAGELVVPRVEDLVSALSTGVFDPGLTLQCKGYFEASSQFCFVYDLPPLCPRPVSPEPPSSLFDHISTNFKPSQTDRLRLAHRVACLIANIHAQGWVHKGIRSENIVFFPRARWGEARSWDNPRLVGFDFARKEGPHEYSEKPLRIEQNIYRHPDALRDPTTSFSRVHDYYALGIVLVEIARCCTIQALLRNGVDFQQSELPEYVMRRVADIVLSETSDENHPRKIRYCMGDRYWSIVKLCLAGSWGEVQSTPDQVAMVFQRDVVEPLGQMAAML